MLLDDGPRRGVVFLCGMSGGNHIAISQVKPGSSNDDFPWFLRRTLILVVLQDADCGLFRTQKRVLADWSRFCAEWSSEHRHAGPCREHE